MASRTPGRPPCRPTAFSALLPLLLGAVPAVADSVEGSLSVSVEVVESCRVPAPSGLGTELVPCPGGGSRAAPTRLERPRARPSEPASARTVVERAADGSGWLTTIF
jgi:hypothetical protein